MPRQIKKATVLRAVADWYDIPEEQITGHKRSRHVVRARQMVMWLLRSMADMSYPEIGEAVNKDHTSALQGVKRMQCLMREDRSWARDAEDLKEIVREEDWRKMNVS